MQKKYVVVKECPPIQKGIKGLQIVNLTSEKLVTENLTKMGGATVIQFLNAARKFL